MSYRHLLYPARLLAVATIYLAAATLGLTMASAHTHVSPVWPPTGIAIAAVLILGHQIWPGILAGAFLVNVLGGVSALTALGMGVGNTLEATLAGLLLSQVGFRKSFDRAVDVIAFVFIAALISPIASATIGNLSLAISGSARWQDFDSLWLTWWLGDAVGALVVAPLLLTWDSMSGKRWAVKDYVEMAVLVLLLYVAGMMIFGGWTPTQAKDHPLAHLSLLFVVWAAFRLGPRGVATAMVLLSAIAIWGTFRGFGSFATDEPNESLLLLQIFIGSSAIMSLVLAAAVEEQRGTQEALSESHGRNVNILESIGDAFIALDRRWRLTYANRKAEQILGSLGRDVPELLNKNLWEEFPHLTRLKFYKECNRAVEEERNVSFEGLYEPTSTWFEVHAYPSPEGLSVYLHDITARKQAELEREQLSFKLDGQRQRVQQMVATVPGVVWEAWGQPDAATQRIDFVSDYIEKMLGYGVDEWLLTPNFWLSVVHPDDRERAAREAAAIFAGKKGGVSRFRWVSKSGKTVWVEAQSIVICDDDGNPVGMRGVTMDISERIEAEESRSKLAALVQSSEDAIIGKTLDGVITSWNRGAERIYGYKEREVVGQHISILAPKDRHAEIDRVLERIRRGEHVEPFETVRITKAGKRVDISLSVSPISDSAGRIVGASTIARDITERKRKEWGEKFLAEASVALASDLNYEATLSTVARLAVPQFADWCAIDIVERGELNRVAVAHADPEKVSWARELYKRFPPDPSKPLGIPNVLRTGQAEFYPEIDERLLDQVAVNAEHREILKQLGFRSAMLVPLKARGHIFGVISFVNAESQRSHTPDDFGLASELANRAALEIDNARLFRAEQQSRQAAERTTNFLMRLQSVTTALSQALTAERVANTILDQALKSIGGQSGIVVALDHDETHLQIVGAVGLDPANMERWKRFELSSPVAVADAVREGSPILIENLEDWTASYPAPGPLSSIPGSQAIAVFPLSLQGRTIGAIGTTFSESQKFKEEDRTFMLAMANHCAQALERARLYEAEHQARTNAEAANRIKDEFLATVSHELRTPLTAILGYAHLLREGKIDAEGLEHSLEVIERNARSQAQIIDDILDVSRIIQGRLALKTQLIEPAAVIGAAIESVIPAAQGKGIRIEKDLDRSIEPLLGDPERLQQIAWNVLSNAVKFTPKGGNVLVRLSDADSYVQLTVRDTGVGITKEFLPHVFERFRQADSTTTREYQGLGLGLAITRHLVELHGGTIEAKSKGEGQGATFTVRLPRPVFLDTRGFQMDSDQPRTYAALDGLRLLIVEDDEDARSLLRLLFERCNASVETASTVADALSVLDTWKPDIIVTDIGFPEEDGFSLIRQVRELERVRGVRIPAIAVSGYAGSHDQSKALEAGFQMHFAKPVDPSELTMAVAKLTGRPVP